MNCSVCGTALAPDVMYCPKCGTPTPAYYASTGSSPNAQTVATPPPAAPYGNVPPYTDYGAQPYGTISPSSSSNLYDSYRGTPPSPPRPNRLPLLIGGVILVLLLIIGGLGVALLRGGGSPPAPSLTSAQMTATAQAQATAAITTSLTATAQASANATATVIA